MKKKYPLKIKYIGESFGVDELTNGVVYEAKEENGMYRECACS